MPTVGTVKWVQRYEISCRLTNVLPTFFVFPLKKTVWGTGKGLTGPKQCMAAMAERECSRLGFMKRFNILMPTLEHPVDNHGNGTVARNVAGCTKRVHSDIEGDHQCLLFLAEA